MRRFFLRHSAVKSAVVFCLAVSAGACAAQGKGPREAVATYLASPPCFGPACRVAVDAVVQVSVKVMRDGSPREIRVVQSSGVSVLDEAAISGVARSGFRPAYDAEGEPVASEISVTYRFVAR